jgi:type IV pilus assembly protein PilW
VSSRNPRKQTGFTLVELMVSMLISTIMIGVALSQLLSSRTLFALQEADSLIEDNARYALEILLSTAAKAGYNDSLSNSQEPGFSQFFGAECDAGYNPCTDDGTGTNPDHIAIWHNPPTGANNEVTCAGVTLNTAPLKQYSIIDLFYVDTATSTLRCRSYSANTSGTLQVSFIPDSDQAIVDGIANMQILYGITELGTIGDRPERYVSALTLENYDDSGDIYKKWTRVVAVKITLLAGTGFDDNMSPTNAATYNLADAPPISINDDNRRKIFSGATAIQNANL